MIPLRGVVWVPLVLLALLSGCRQSEKARISAELDSLKACEEVLKSGFLPIAGTRDARFQGKVEEITAKCRGGASAVGFRSTPWVDWANYWGVGGPSSKAP